MSKEYYCLLITGPRQEGKATILKQLAERNQEYVKLDNHEERKLAQNDSTLFMQLHNLPIFIDEVQYALQLFSYIKIAIDNGVEPESFWISGSQVFRMMELVQKSLVGRVAILYMPSLLQYECFYIL